LRAAGACSLALTQLGLILNSFEWQLKAFFA
jgi:hypothetical protein